MSQLTFAPAKTLPTIPDPHKGSRGCNLTVRDLPAKGTIRRWSREMKWIAVMAVERGLLTKEEACARWDITVRELARWKEDAHAGILCPHMKQPAPSK